MSPSSGIEPPKLAIQVGLRELTTLLIKHADFHEGLYDFSAVMSVTIGTFALAIDQPPMPGTLSALSAVGLMKVDTATPNSIDAAKVNPIAAVPDAKRARARR